MKGSRASLMSRNEKGCICKPPSPAPLPFLSQFLFTSSFSPPPGYQLGRIVQDLLGTRGLSIEGRHGHLKGGKGIMGKQRDVLLPSDRRGSYSILSSRRGHGR